MDKFMRGFIKRNLPQFIDNFDVIITNEKEEKYKITAKNNVVTVEASNYICACNGIYEYLKEYCNVQYSWCGTFSFDLKELKMFDGVFEKTIDQHFRVYLNYCTLDYSMCWWDFARWEKEIDFMAMNGINMPLTPIGSEAVWYEALQEFNFTKEEALGFISGPAFWAWQLMTNIDSYISPKSEEYVYNRLELGKKIIERCVEFGMQPIQQGFSGHVPTLLKEKYPNATILMQKGWCLYPETAQLDPLDKLFLDFGRVFLEKTEKLIGNYHYIACDPFHEGTPPKDTKEYLCKVGQVIDKLYKDFDEKSVWVMQAWTMHEEIVNAVPKDRILLLDLNSERAALNPKVAGYDVVSGMLHNFGGKNAMQGKLRKHCENKYLTLKEKGANVVGSGMFMEGIDQNPVIYDLQFELLTAQHKLDIEKWLDKYITRRYGKYNEKIRQAWDILLKTCYKDDGYEENEVGSTLAARPQLMPKRTGPCCVSAVYYNTKEFERAVDLFISVADEFEDSKGYQYDLCDMVRQCFSNRFYDNQKQFSKYFKLLRRKKCEKIAQTQLELLLDMDSFISCRSEMTLAKWICDAHNLAKSEEEKKYFDLNARTLITFWGDINGSTSALYDYSWREWSGLIKEYYYKRWQMFYDYALGCLKHHKIFVYKNGNDYAQREKYMSFPFGKKLGEFELEWGKTYSEYEYPENRNVVPEAKYYCKKWSF